MKDKKLYFILIGQTKCIELDLLDDRTISSQVVAELCMIPEEVLPDDIAKVANMADDYIEYSYDMKDEKPMPKWVKDEWFGENW